MSETDSEAPAKATPLVPWSVKGVPMAERQLAARKAKAADMKLGKWLAEAIREKGEQQLYQPGQAPATRDLPAELPNELPRPKNDIPASTDILSTDIGGLAASLAAVTEAAKLHDTKPTKTFINDVAKTARAYAQAARGARPTPRATKPEKRHTEAPTITAQPPAAGEDQAGHHAPPNRQPTSEPA